VSRKKGIGIEICAEGNETDTLMNAWKIISRM
jgi:hypothetical protein